MSTQRTATILITGATGSIGTALTKILSEQGVPFKAMVRNTATAKDLAVLPGATLVEGDFNHAASLSHALKGIEKAFLLTNSSEEAAQQQIRFVAAAKIAGVKHIVKLSQWAADVNSPVRFLRYHAAVEAAIIDSGIAYTFLRPNLFMQGFLGFKDIIAKNAKFFAAAADARISLIDVRDIAAVAAAALTGGDHENKIYNLMGPEVLTHQQIAEIFSRELGTEIRFIDVPDEAMKEALLGVGMPEWQTNGLLEDYAHYRLQEAAVTTSVVKDVTGKAPRTFAQFVRDYAPLFKGL
jgi:uncharacterized protein YbjT (DUF2867 family)